MRALRWALTLVFVRVPEAIVLTCAILALLVWCFFGWLTNDSAE